MAESKRELRQQARRLRQDGMSVREIAETLHVARSSVSVWVRDIQLTQGQIDRLKDKQRQSAGRYKGSQTNRAKYRALRCQYQQEGRESAKLKRPLHFAGCMLYWAEGAKHKNALYFVNSDHHMLRLFMRFLREELHVSNLDVTLYIQCHSSDPDEIRRIERYWIDTLELEPSCLRKTHIKKGTQYRKSTLENGVCGINVLRSTPLLHHIYGAIQEYGGFDNPAWLF